MANKIHSLKDLKTFVRQLVKDIKGGAVVALSGELGSGKTTLTQLIGRELGVKEKILSPTFVIFKTYPVGKDAIKRLCHIDLYRLTDFSHPHGFEEFVGRQDVVCFIEWAEKLKNKLPAGAIWIKISVNPDNSRSITKMRQQDCLI